MVFGLYVCDEVTDAICAPPSLALGVSEPPAKDDSNFSFSSGGDLNPGHVAELSTVVIANARAVVIVHVMMRVVVCLGLNVCSE